MTGLPPMFFRTKWIFFPAVTPVRSEAFSTLNFIVIDGHFSAGIGPCAMVIVAALASTALTVP